MKKMDNSVEILGIKISGTQRARVLRKIALERKKLMHLATVNSEFVMQAKDNRKFADTLDAVDETVADGIGVVWAARLLHGNNIDRITGVELVEEILRLSKEQGKKVFLLGAQPGVAERAARAMIEAYPGAEIRWYEGARMVLREERAEAGMTIAKINSFEPDYLLVAYGSPWQDMWIEENRPYLRAKVAIGVGGALDEWAGVVKRCPKWIENAGFKWLWRLVHEPWRWRRQWRLVRFAWNVLNEWLRKS